MFHPSSSLHVALHPFLGHLQWFPSPGTLLPFHVDLELDLEGFSYNAIEQSAKALELRVDGLREPHNKSSSARFPATRGDVDVLLVADAGDPSQFLRADLVGPRKESALWAIHGGMLQAVEPSDEEFGDGIVDWGGLSVGLLAR